MVIVCLNGPFGGFDSLYDQIKDSLTHPPLFSRIVVPDIIGTLQEKMFSTVEDIVDAAGNLVERTRSYISSVNLEVCHLLSHLNDMSFFDLIIKGVKKILDFVGLSNLFRSFFPKILGLGISIYDIIVGGISPKEIYKAIREAIDNGLDVLWSFVPKPFYIDLNLPDISLPNIFQMIMKQYKDIILKPIMDLVGILTDFLDSISLGLFSFTLPQVPSIGEIVNKLYEKIKLFAIAKAIDLKNMVIGGFNEVMSLARKMMNFGMKISDLLNGLSFGSLTGWLFKAIDNMFNTVKMMSVELLMQVNNMIDSIYNFLYKTIWDFITSLPVIGDIIKAIFSPICIPIPTVQDAVNEATSVVASAIPRV
jgi:hypothetical protein